MNKKTLTNLYDEPQMRVTTFEPVASNTHDLGSPEYKWNDVYVNRIIDGSSSVQAIVPFGLEGPGAAPATRALNSGYDLYFQRLTSTTSVLTEYGPSPSSPGEVITRPPVGTFIMTSRASTLNTIYLYWRTPDNEWVSYYMGAG